MNHTTNDTDGRTNGKNRLVVMIYRYGVATGFLLFFFAYLLLAIEPPIIASTNGFGIGTYLRYLHDRDHSPATAREPDRYSGDGYILELTAQALGDRLAVPGGPSHLAVTLVVYACNHPVAGALAILGVVLLLVVLIPLYCAPLGGRTPLFITLLPAIAILAALHRYECDVLAVVFPILGAFAFAVLLQRFGGSTFWFRSSVLTALCWIAWYLFHGGVFAFLAFVVLDALVRRAWPRTTLVLSSANAIAVFLIETMLVPPENALHFDLFVAGGAPWIAGSLFLPPVLAIVRPKALMARMYGHVRSRHLLFLADALLVVALTGATVAWARLDPVLRDSRTMALTAHRLHHQQWEKIIATDYRRQFRSFPQNYGPLQKYLVHARMRSLAHAGRLGSDMFSTPQSTFSAEPLLLRRSILDFGFPQWVSAADLFMELGLVNYAEKTLGELMECMGPYPFLIYRRSLLHIAKNNPQTAAVYLKKLSGMPPYRSKARRLLGMLHDSSALAAEPVVAHLRACMDTTDYFFLAADEEELLRRLLARNPGNRLAFEYLMATSLLNGTVEKTMELLTDAPRFGYTLLPRHWEEAICVYMSREDHDPLAGESLMRLVSPATFHRFDQFMQAYFPLEGSPDAATKLGPLFGSTYYYFYTFESSTEAHR